jgi:hypothetical protein
MSDETVTVVESGPKLRDLAKALNRPYSTTRKWSLQAGGVITEGSHTRISPVMEGILREWEKGATRRNYKERVPKPKAAPLAPASPPPPTAKLNAAVQMMIAVCREAGITRLLIEDGKATITKTTTTSTTEVLTS